MKHQLSIIFYGLMVMLAFTIVNAITYRIGWVWAWEIKHDIPLTAVIASASVGLQMMIMYFMFIHEEQEQGGMY